MVKVGIPRFLLRELTAFGRALKQTYQVDFSVNAGHQPYLPDFLFASLPFLTPSMGWVIVQPPSL